MLLPPFDELLAESGAFRVKTHRDCYIKLALLAFTGSTASSQGWEGVPR